MKRPLILVVLVVSLLLPALFIRAAVGVDDRGNPNDPAVNPRANACYTGGSLEGKCHTEVEWVAGWYLIRFESGILSRDEVPEDYQWVLPDVPVLNSAPAPTATVTPKPL